MIVSKLKLKNFMNVESCDLEFNEGINVIGGSNGMGKSVLFAAQAFCLVGNKRGDSWKDFIKIGTDKMEIDLVLYKFKGDEPMTFHIEGLASSSSMVKEIRYGSEFARNTECDAFLEKFFDLEMMENVLFHLQESESITNITPAKRREVLKKIFNSDFSNIVEKIKLDATTVKDKIKENETTLKILENKVFQPYILERVPNINVKELAQKCDESRKLIVSTQELITLKREQYIRKLEEKKKNDSRLMELTIKISDITRKMEATPSFSQEESEESLQEKVNLNLKEIEDLTVLNADLDPLIKQYEEQIEGWKKELQKHKLILVEENVRLSSIEKQLKVFETSNACPLCGQECSEEHKNTLAKERDDTFLTIQGLDIIYKEKELEVNDNTHFLNTSKSSFATNEKKKIQLENDNKLLENKKESSRKAQMMREATLNEYKERLQELTEEKIGVEKLIADSSSSMVDEGIEKELLQYESFISEKESEILKDATSIKEVETILLRNSEKEKFNSEIKKQEKENTELKGTLSKEVDDMKKEIIDLDYVRTVYESELPNHIMIRACQFLEDGINSFMLSTKDNFRVKLVQNPKGIDFFYKAREEPEWLKAKMASGFESALLTLAFKFTVALAYDSRFIIFDEPDKAADEESSLRLIQTITNVEGFNQVFITTHRPRSLSYLQENDANIIMVNNGVYSQI